MYIFAPYVTESINSKIRKYVLVNLYTHSLRKSLFLYFPYLDNFIKHILALQTQTAFKT